MPTVGINTPLATLDPLYQSNGGGEPRSPSYWLLWNTCVPENRATQAAANGGREAGWFILDDLLEDPGILLGALVIETCDQGVNLLQGRDLQGEDRQNDTAYFLVTELLTAQLNLAVGSENCPAVSETVSDAGLILLKLEFNGAGSYLGPPVASPERDEARVLAERLGMYNAGELCR